VVGGEGVRKCCWMVLADGEVSDVYYCMGMRMNDISYKYVGLRFIYRISCKSRSAVHMHCLVHVGV